MDELRHLWQSADREDRVVLVRRRELMQRHFVHETACALSERFRALGAGHGIGVGFEDDQYATGQKEGLDVIALLACILIGATWCVDGGITSCPGVMAKVSRKRTDDSFCFGTAWLSLKRIGSGHRWPPDALYLIGTSGSTGKQKVVVGSAKQTARRLRWRPCTAQYRRTPVTFVDSIAEMLGIVSHCLVLDGPIVGDCDLVTLTPSLLSIMLKTGALMSAKRVHCSGEPLPMSLVHRFGATFPDATLYNIWGSSEISADATFAVVWPPARRENCCEACCSHDVSCLAPIGAPLDGVQVDLSDDSELVVTGASALGYADEALWTDNVVRTGDVGRRCLECGALIFSGRRDDMVKVGGRKVNLRQLEMALFDNKDASVDGACIYDDGGDDPSKAAVIVFSTRGIKVPLYAKLAIVHTLPLTRSGKIDKLRLKQMTFAEAGGTSLEAMEIAYRLGLSPDQVMTRRVHQLATRSEVSAWSIRLGKCVDAPPLLWGNCVFIGSHSKKFVKAHVDGRVEWEARIGDCGDQSLVKDDAALEAGAETDGRLIFVGCYDGCMYALDGEDGRLCWTYSSGAQIKNKALVIDSDRLVFGCHDARVHCVSTKDGSVVWLSIEFDGAVFGTPALYRDMLLFATTHRTIGALQATTGSVVWTIESKAPVFASLIVRADSAFFGDMTSHNAIHPNTGRTRWSYFSSAAVFARVLADKNDEVIFASNAGELTARSQQDGRKRWALTLPSRRPIFANPCWLRNKAFAVFDTDGSLFVIKSGEPVRQITTLPGQVFSSPVAFHLGDDPISGDQFRLIVGCRDDTVRAIDVALGVT